MRLFNSALKVLRSRLVAKVCHHLSPPQKQDVLLGLWQHFKRRLQPHEVYEMMKKTYMNMKMFKYPLTPSYLYPRIASYFYLVNRLAHVPGAVVECGVDKGFSLASIVYAIAFYGQERTVWAFDSFSGFPRASAEDIGPESQASREGVPPPGYRDTSEELVRTVFEQDTMHERSLLRQHQVSVKVVRGFFESTMKHSLPDTIALLHVDCDLYSSTKTALDLCYPRMAEGGLILFDEYNELNYPGEGRAADEFAERTGQTIVYIEAIKKHGIWVRRERGRGMPAQMRTQKGFGLSKARELDNGDGQQ